MREGELDKVDYFFLPDLSTLEEILGPANVDCYDGNILELDGTETVVMCEVDDPSELAALHLLDPLQDPFLSEPAQQAEDDMVHEAFAEVTPTYCFPSPFMWSVIRGHAPKFSEVTTSAPTPNAPTTNQNLFNGNQVRL